MKKQNPGTKKPPLAIGQLWQLKAGYLQITGVGKRLIEYKMLRQPGQRVVQRTMSNHADVAAYLKTNKGKLVVAAASGELETTDR